MRTAAARKVARLVAKSGWLKPGQHIGLYLSMPEELDTAPLLALALQRGCTIALPRVVAKRQGRMRFYDLSGGVRRGAFGILEPAGAKLRPSRSLDLVFVPLVGFDPQGNRMGMGRGFYDIGAGRCWSAWPMRPSACLPCRFRAMTSPWMRL
jgi:5-formyltetrahydrofolate cyclo-ligase